MDDRRFHRLVQALGRGLNRRGALGLVAGVAGLRLGGVAARWQRL